MRGQWGYIAISFVIGIAIACSSFKLLYIGLFCCYILFCIYRTSRRILFFCILACSGSFLYTSYVEWKNQHSKGLDFEITEGVIQTTPLINGDRLSFQMEVNDRDTLQLMYKIQSVEQKEQLQKLHAGMSCTFQGEMKVPSEARNFHGFDYRDYLHKQKIHFLFEAKEISNCIQKSLTFTQWVFLLRQNAVSIVAEMFPGQSGAFMNALLFGDRQLMTFEVEEQYQQFGLIHLLAISGSHIVLLMAIGYFVLLRIGVTREMATICLIICIPLYMFLAGASPSVMRASVTGVMLLLALMHSIRVSSLDALSMTAVLMLLYNPYMAFDIGFQFSFVGSFALLLSASRLLQHDNGLIQNTIYLSVISQLASTPILLYHFGYFSPYSIFLNLLYVPLLSCVVLPCSIVIFACILFVPFVAKWLAQMLSVCLTISNDILQYCENLPFLRFTFGQTPLFLIVLYCFSIVSIFIVWERVVRKKFLFLTVGFFLFICIFHYISPYFRTSGSVTFIDVGQGDAILIRLPYEKGVYLIDTGGTIPVKKEAWQKKKHEFSVGHDILLPFLQKEGIRKIDKLIVTHGDTDHMGAAKELLSAITVGEIVFGKKRADAVVEKELKKIAKEKNIRINIVGEGDGWQVDEAIFTVLSPEGGEKEDNDSSIVLWVKLGGFIWLFTGDLEEKGERRIVEQYPELRADILKVGHHGSKTSSSSSFLHLIQPKKAIISAGEHNRYGHPHQQVLERLLELDIEIWRTDKQGAISYVFEGERGTFQSKLTYDEAQKR
ncbi:DNA internalization-related competence protein ComEC/Rec2 [Bacillus pseudomycoides]|uniref:DNA internalization-related competence protein ComEC/Rec2 n=1 Tax=Bacillus pseudomycoides TaxID=64104 RepID=A0AAJ1YY34_9BACI|nr:DNA internalization-related competence protein ComEC/Rec2 [Bacillus pseudomycoides]MDR4325895.1 DNA internalization-related competence protein ComEC/Rec2 [Bacillus pseudomycoides]MED1537333.1 DNA internalization-related competence protein ComEC/Rec2 [Bacillus pseudomycoides]PFZ98771.1 DNA internalization-related competence protein ComEC/Rec2 [Bacillus pseudomycoides]PHD17980.1 DNA internalization-related competence protein ComEC/Rec2 [Bacillus pseudomycoides]